MLVRKRESGLDASALEGVTGGEDDGVGHEGVGDGTEELLRRLPPARLPGVE